MEQPREIVRSLNTHNWAPERERLAVLLIDLQEYFRQIITPILPKVVAVAQAARAAAIPLLFTRHGHRKGEDAGMLGAWWDEIIVEGSDEARLLPELGAGEPDIIIPKDRYSAFHKTDLEDRLKAMGIQDLVIGGVMTNLCCETTARDAFARDFRVFFLADGTSTMSEDFHRASLLNLSYGFATLLCCDDLIASLSGRGA